MANLRTRILVRVVVLGKRGWVHGTGRNDPPGSYYIRHFVGSKPKYVCAGKTFDEALVAQVRLERVLKAASIGAVIQEEVPTGPKNHRISAAIEKYLKDQAELVQHGRKSPKSLNSKKSELNKFAAQCGKTYVEEINRDVLLAFRYHLEAEGYQPDTVYNKMMDVVTWLKHNGVVPYVKLLTQVDDWPTKKDTVPDPYTDEEITAMKSYAIYDEELLIRFFVATGMRKGEVSVAEREDINAKLKGIHVRRSKPQHEWSGKNEAAKRFIYLGDDLLATLLKRPPGLLFPIGGHRNTHLLRTIERLATLAGVTPTSAKKDTHPEAVKNDWCHRFRDTWLTRRVERAKDVNALRAICKEAGHSNLETLNVYAAQRKADDPETRADANAMDTGSKISLVRSA